MVLMKSGAVTYTWVDTSAGRVGMDAQEDISAGTVEVGTAQVGMEDWDMAPDTLEVGKVQGT